MDADAKVSVEQIETAYADCGAGIRWADVIFVMEEKHMSRLFAEFTTAVEHKPVHVLDIPDEYKYMDPELVEQLRRSVGALLGLV